MNPMETQAQTTLLHRRSTIHKLFKANAEEEKRLQEEVTPDWPDRALVRESATLLERLTDAERRELMEIDASLERIARGVYGRCESCERPIGRQRLRAMPEARYCISCCERREHPAP